MSEKNILSLISDPATNTHELIELLKKTEKISAPSIFWSGIANNDSFSNEYRRIVIFELFVRHVKNRISLNALAEIVNKPVWLRPENISEVKEIAGKIPVTFDINDTILVIEVLPEISNPEHSSWAIYLRIDGKISKEDFYKIMCMTEKNTPAPLEQKMMKEYGLSPDKKHMYNQ
jgi:hypothetical protein